MAEARELAAVPRVAGLGTVAQGEQGLLAAQPPAGLGDRETLVGAHGVGAQVARLAGEGAVRADVPAQVRERDEDLARVGDDPRPGPVAQAGGGRPQGRVLGAAGVGERPRLGAGEALAREGGLDRVSDRRAQRRALGVGHQPGSGPWPSRNLRQSAGRFSWKLAIPSLGSGP